MSLKNDYRISCHDAQFDKIMPSANYLNLLYDSALQLNIMTIAYLERSANTENGLFCDDKHWILWATQHEDVSLRSNRFFSCAPTSNTFRMQPGFLNPPSITFPYDNIPYNKKNSHLIFIFIISNNFKKQNNFKIKK